jgi:hypothetical protein
LQNCADSQVVLSHDRFHPYLVKEVSIDAGIYSVYNLPLIVMICKRARR